MVDNQKKFVPKLAIDTKFFHSAFFNPCTMHNQRRGVRLTAHFAIECLMVNYFMRWRRIFKGLSQVGGQVDFY